MIDSCTYLGNNTQPCGCPSLVGRSYCSEHYPLIYKLGTARAQRNKDKKTAAAVWDLESEFNQAVQELVEEGYNFDEPLWDVETEES